MMFSRLKKVFSFSNKRKQIETNPQPKEDRYILVLSGGGTRGFYHGGILKAIEESWLKEKIDAIFGVSAGAIVGSYRASWWTASEIFDRFITMEMSPAKRLKFPPQKSILTNTLIKKQLEKDLPETFEELSMKMYVSATDICSAHLITFDQGKLVEPVLGSMAIPGVFPTIAYQDYVLMDGGLIDNFPTTLAQKMYPHHKIIWVALNKFRENQTPKNMVESLLLALEIMLRKDMVKRTENVDTVFYEEIDCGRLERDKAKLQKTFYQGYEAGMKKFKTLV